MSIAFANGTLVYNDATSKLRNLQPESNNSFGISWILLAASNEPFTVKLTLLTSLLSTEQTNHLYFVQLKIK